MAKLHPIASRRQSNRGSVIFVHGLNGHPFKTWGGSGPDDPHFWPAWLAKEPDLASANIYVLEYEAAPSRIFGKAMSLLDDGKSILGVLKSEEALFQGPIAFICHSLGGIVLKQILHDADQEAKHNPEANALLHRISQVVFVATPHKGAKLPLLFERLSLLFWPTAIMRSLRYGDEAMLDLGQWYTNFCCSPQRKIRHLVFSERKRTYGFQIVNAASAQPGVACETIPVMKNHIDIAKPPDADAEVYRLTLALLKLLPENRLHPLPPEMRFSREDELRVDTDYWEAAISVYERREIMEWLRPSLEKTGWRLDELEKGEGCTNVAYNRELLTAAPVIRRRILPGLWTAYENRNLQRVFAIKKAMRKSGDLFNERKIRLAGDFIDNRRTEVAIQQTDYLSSLTTDQLAWTQICSRRLRDDGISPEHLLWDGLGAFIEIDEQSQTASLKSFSRADISNQLGASTLAFSSDGHLMIVYQSKHNLQSESFLAPSGSGSSDWSDVADSGATDLLSLALFGAQRELAEECALNDDGTGRMPLRSKLIVTGFARMLHRGGKPEFYCLAKIDATYDELCAREPERYVERITRANYQRADWQRNRPCDEIAQVCKHYLGSIGPGRRRVPFSYPLQHALMILIDACADEPSRQVLDRFILEPF